MVYWHINLEHEKNTYFWKLGFSQT